MIYDLIAGYIIDFNINDKFFTYQINIFECIHLVVLFNILFVLMMFIGNINKN